ncbi:hypothetical protein LIER_33180 [Lithospermum erythrorhizon]|uniref:Gag-pol polyprotein n=1 Tax=Lithospermum erythrorhizon TaxID=34254 RepID=A0AAV3RZW1_LITER
MGFDELIGNLTTFEMMFEATELNKGKGVALQVSISDKREENLAETVNMLAQNFNKTLKHFNKKPYSGGSTQGSFDQGLIRDGRARSLEGSTVVEMCKAGRREYNAGNVKDSVTSRDTKETTVNLSVNEGMTDIKSHEEGDLTEEKLMANYQLLFIKWLKLTRAYTSGEVERVVLLKKNEDLMQCVERQKLELRILEDKIQGMIKGIKMMNSSTTVLDEILLQGKRSEDNTGVGFSGLPNLEDVLLVEGLTTNLISISQLCDDGMKVAFNKETCSMNNQSDNLIMQGNRSTDNCYVWTSPQKALSSRV